MTNRRQSIQQRLQRFYLPGQKLLGKLGGAKRWTIHERFLNSPCWFVIKSRLESRAWCFLNYATLLADELLRLCVEADAPEAWDEFVRRYRDVIAVTVSRKLRHWGTDVQQRAEDLVQDTYLKLFTDDYRALRRFASKYPDSIYGYLKVTAENVVRDYCKREFSKKRGSGTATEVVEEVDPPADDVRQGGSGAMHREVLLSEIDVVLDDCAEGPHRERNRMVFWLCHHQGMTAREIAEISIIRLKTKGVEALLWRLIKCIREKLTGVELGEEGRLGEAAAD